MLHIPDSSSHLATLMGLDPGSDSFGVAVLSIDISTMEIVESDAKTIFGSKLASKDSWTEELYGNREARIRAIEDELVHLFQFYQPVSIASESPFINNKFPQAGIALTEVICAIRRAVYRYSVWRQLDLIPPSNVKNAVFASGDAGKTTMKDKVLSLQHILKYKGVLPIQYLDEHSIDALAVAYARLLRYREEYV